MSKEVVEILARFECEREGIDPDDIVADGGIVSWMVQAKDVEEHRIAALTAAGYTIDRWSDDMDKARQIATKEKPVFLWTPGWESAVIGWWDCIDGGDDSVGEQEDDGSIWLWHIMSEVNSPMGDGLLWPQETSLPTLWCHLPPLKDDKETGT